MSIKKNRDLMVEQIKRLRGQLNEANWKDRVEEIEVSIDGLSVEEFAKATAAALNTSYGRGHGNRFLNVLKRFIE